MYGIKDPVHEPQSDLNTPQEVRGARFFIARKGFYPHLQEIVFQMILVPQNSVKYHVQT